MLSSSRPPLEHNLGFSMDDEDLYVTELRQEIVRQDLHMKSLIQDIYNCKGPLELLSELNADGRKTLSALSGNISEMRVHGVERQNSELVSDADNYREQYYNTYKMFRQANVSAMLTIEKENKNELFQQSDEETILRKRQKKDKANLVKMSSNITDQLLSISRHLADTSQMSADTLSSLANASSTVHGASDELSETKGVISQSGKLLAKYSRRQFTDKLILLLGFAFFIACVLYVVKKRIW